MECKQGLKESAELEPAPSRCVHCTAGRAPRAFQQTIIEKTINFLLHMSLTCENF